jgi:hypothetical protein
VKHFVTLDATQPEDDVTCEVVDLTQEFYRAETAKLMREGA